MNCEGYILRQSYPPVVPGRCDRALVRRLFSAYGGQDGEMTAIVQYFYNSLITGMQGENEISHLFSCISQVEMHHLRLLGQLILAYGGDPGLLSFRGDRKIWWSGDFVHHLKQSDRMLREAIAGEQAAIRDYGSLLKLMPDDGNRAVIERILTDEHHHAALLNRQLRGGGKRTAP